MARHNLGQGHILMASGKNTTVGLGKEDKNGEKQYKDLVSVYNQQSKQSVVLPKAQLLGYVKLSADASGNAPEPAAVFALASGNGPYKVSGSKNDPKAGFRSPEQIMNQFNAAAYSDDRQREIMQAVVDGNIYTTPECSSKTKKGAYLVDMTVEGTNPKTGEPTTSTKQYAIAATTENAAKTNVSKLPYAKNNPHMKDGVVTEATAKPLEIDTAALVKQEERVAAAPAPEAPAAEAQAEMGLA